MAPWLSTLAYSAGTVILVAGVFSLAQSLLARLYGEMLGETIGEAAPGQTPPPEDRASAARSGR